MYQETVEALPHVFAWRDSQAIMDAVHALGVAYGKAVTQRAFEHVGKIDPQLAQSMSECLQRLPEHAVARFVTAPETLHRTLTLPHDKKPAGHISFLCNALMAERALSEKDGGARPCWTA